MKKNQLCLQVLAFSFLLLFTNCNTEDIAPQEKLNNITLSKSEKNGKSFASGQGGLSYGEGTKTQHFSFHASLDGDGNVSGSWESKSPSQEGVRTHGTIDCMTFVDDQTAVLSGTITQSSADEDGLFAGYFAGASVWFKVVDNGEGSNSDPDQFSDYYAGFGGCELYTPALRDIETGNIQVKR